MPMEGLRRRLSFRKKKKDRVPECSKPHQWQEDEKKVRDGTCSFQVRYLGCVEVFESRGMQVCEEAVKTLKANCKGKYHRAILYVSGDALRVVDEISKSMIVDQTIEKVSFCAPDRNHEKGFAYICRDGTTRRWMCHGFLAVKESRFWRSHKIKRKKSSTSFQAEGERLSHAVGCAFAICLERKQKRDKDSGATNVTVTYSNDRTSFTRMGSFRQTTMTERITDPQSAILAEPVPVRKVDNPFAVQRPHATENMLVRQGSFRGFQKLQEASSPFKRTLSLRLNELPSTLQRQNAVEWSDPKMGLGGINNNGVIPEMSPENDDSISQMCQQLTQGLSALAEDPFSRAPHQGSPHAQGLVKQQSMPATFHSSSQATVVTHPAPPVHETNPWGARGSGATSQSDTFARASPATTNPFLSSTPPLTNGMAGTGGSPATHLQTVRSHSIDTSDMSSAWGQSPHTRKQTLLQMAHHQNFQTTDGTSSNSKDWADWSATNSAAPTTTTNSQITQNQSSTRTTEATSGFVDPFDVAWAAKPGQQEREGSPSNPFSTKTVKKYKVDL